MKDTQPQFTHLNGSHITVGIITAQWNSNITSSLRDGVYTQLRERNVLPHNIIEDTVPGSFELPYACQRMIHNQNVDVVIPVGCLIKGSTMHFEYIAQAVSYGLTQVSLNTNTPVLFGILTCLTEEQALERSQGKGNHGPSWADSALALIT